MTEHSDDKIQRICRMCSQSYLAAAGTDPDECVSCMIARAQADSALASHERKLSEQRALSARIKTSIGARFLVGALILLAVFGFFAANAIQHAREGAAERHREDAKNNVYVIKISNFKWRMCHCEDFTCATKVKADFEAWHAAQTVPSDTDVKQAARSEIESLMHCFEQLRL